MYGILNLIQDQVNVRKNNKYLAEHLAHATSPRKTTNLQMFRCIPAEYRDCSAKLSKLSEINYCSSVHDLKSCVHG